MSPRSRWRLLGGNKANIHRNERKGLNTPPQNTHLKVESDILWALHATLHQNKLLAAHPQQVCFNSVFVPLPRRGAAAVRCLSVKL